MNTLTRRAVTTAVLAGLTISACSSGKKAAPAITNTTSSVAPSTTGTTAKATTTTNSSVAATTTTAAPAPTYPLTGLPLDADAVERPALVVKMDNSPEIPNRSHAGINNTDVVYEEEVEGITRFLTVFQSNDANPVGPIRSARTSDPDIVAALSHPLFAWSGGNGGVEQAIGRADLINVGYDVNPGAGYFRDRNRREPHNLLSDTKSLYAAMIYPQGNPKPLFGYRTAADPLPGAEAVTGVKLQMDGTPSQWTWDAAASTWLRDQYGHPHEDTDGKQVSAVNVAIQFSEYRRSPADPRSPEAITIGEGPLWVLTGGKLVSGTWKRPDGGQPAEYFTEDGKPIKLLPGNTWVELARAGEAEPLRA